MEIKMKFEKKKPLFYGGIVIMFPKSITHYEITNLLGKDIEIQTYNDMIEVTYKELKNFSCWEVNEMMTNLFSMCDLDFLLSVKNKYSAEIWIDISFHHYSQYPALIFDGKNMDYIHMLKANISIDVY